MKRRHFIFLTSAGIAAIGIPVLYSKLGSIEFPQLLAQPELLESIWDRDTISGIGQAYLETHPSEDRQNRLVKLLYQDIPQDKVDAGQIAEAIKRDFQAGDLVEVDGWILSRTEARQCALFSLTSS
ncbi:MAG: hypothetical protein AAF587_31325 [Bacteroidota bacterium]